MAARLRYVWGQRSLARKWVALFFVVVGLGAVGVAYAPDAWLATTRSTLASLPSLFNTVGVQPILLAAAAVCLLIGVSVFVMARPRRYRYDVVRAGIVAPVSVYLDAENQLLSPQEVQDFISQLRIHLDGRRADLIYYADAGHAARTRTYLTLYRFGFRPVDVPHTPLGVDAAKNIVDVELALHAYQRALLGPVGQEEVILVSADRDYLPLVYRLRAMELTVGVWANRVPDAYKDLQEYLGIQVVEFGVESAPAKDQQTSDSAGAQQTSGLHSASQSASLPEALEQVDSLAQALSFTLALIQAVSRPDQTAGERFTLVRRRTELPGYDIAGMIGYSTENRTALWLTHVRTLGVVSGGPKSTLLGPGPVTVEDGVALFERFFGELQTEAEKLADVNRERLVKLTTLCRYVTKAPEAQADDPLTGLRKHLRSSLAGNPALCVTEMQGLCRLSKLFGVPWFEETTRPNFIIVQLR